jgi:DNA-binding NtrC family response regulator
VKSSAGTAEKFAPVAEAPMTPPSVLVDDEPLVRWSLTERLTRESYRVLEASTAAYSTVENAADAIALGAFDYVNKPFDVDDMALLVEKALSIRDLDGPYSAFPARSAS